MDTSCTSPSTCHMASRVLTITASNPSRLAIAARSGWSRVPLTQPAPAGLPLSQSTVEQPVAVAERPDKRTTAGSARPSTAGRAGGRSGRRTACRGGRAPGAASTWARSAAASTTLGGAAGGGGGERPSRVASRRGRPAWSQPAARSDPADECPLARVVRLTVLRVVADRSERRVEHDPEQGDGASARDDLPRVADRGRGRGRRG